MVGRSSMLTGREISLSCAHVLMGYVNEISLTVSMEDPPHHAHGIVYFKHMALFTYDNEISLSGSMEDLPDGTYTPDVIILHLYNNYVFILCFPFSDKNSPCCTTCAFSDTSKVCHRGDTSNRTCDGNSYCT